MSLYQFKFRADALAITTAGAILIGGAPAVAAEKVRFPFSPISCHSLPFLIAHEARMCENYGFEVDPIFAGGSSLIVHAMLAIEADLAGVAGPAVISNVLRGGAVQKTPLIAYDDNRYVDELDKSSFFEKLWP
jgi:hypothetical protein